MAEGLLKLEDGPTDANLVTRACAGDDAAKRALFQRHVGMAAGLAFRLIGIDAEIDDIVQDAFVAAFGGLARLERPQAFAAWLRTIVTGTAIGVLRRRRLLWRLGFRSADAIIVERVVSPSAPPDVAVELRAIYGLIERLPAHERVVLVLRRVEQLSLEEIAQQTGASLATVKRRLTAADRHLAAALAPAGEGSAA